MHKSWLNWCAGPAAVSRINALEEALYPRGKSWVTTPVSLLLCWDNFEAGSVLYP